jgi:hypothetical protein
MKKSVNVPKRPAKEKNMPNKVTNWVATELRYVGDERPMFWEASPSLTIQRRGETYVWSAGWDCDDEPFREMIGFAATLEAAQAAAEAAAATLEAEMDEVDERNEAVVCPATKLSLPRKCP